MDILVNILITTVFWGAVQSGPALISAGKWISDRIAIVRSMEPERRSIEQVFDRDVAECGVERDASAM